MPLPVTSLPARSAAGAALGAALGLNLRVLSDLCGAGPTAMIGGGAAVVAAVALLPRARGAARALPVLAAAIFWGFEGFGGALGAHLDPRTVVLLLDGIAVAALLAPLAGGHPAPGALASVVAAVSAGLFFGAPRELAAPGAALLVIVAARVLPDPGAPLPWAPVRSLGAALGFTAALGVWVAARAPLDPTGLGWIVLAMGGLLGASLPRTPAAALAAVALPSAVAAWAAGPAWIDGHLERLAGGVGALVVGLGAGALLAALRPGRAFGVGVMLAPAAATWLLPLLPSVITAPATRSLASFGENATARARTESLRTGSTPTWAALGPTGATALWAREKGVFADLDGTVADPSSRAGDAESFAGTLGACVAPGRGRARVAGDDLVLVTRALTAQGFLAIDVAVPDRGFARAHAALLPGVASTWLKPSVRAVGVSAPLLLRMGRPADLVVEVARTGWTDGRSVVPDRRGFAAVRRTLVDGGVYVLALGTTRLGEGDFGRIVDDLLATFPDVTAWSPPAGVDTALFVARPVAAPVPWDRVTACVRADADGLRPLAIRTPEDVAGRLVTDAGGLRAAARPGRAPLGLPVVRAEPDLPLLDLHQAAFDPATWFGPDAPAAVLRARHTSQGEFFALLRDRDQATIQDAISRARLLGAGNSQVVATLIRPHLDRARAAMARAAEEGIGSHAWQEAETALANAELIAPGHADTACARGRLAEMKNDTRQAEEAFVACVAADPENLVGLDGVARMARIRGDVAAAEVALRKAWTVAPERASTSFNLGQLLYVTGRYEESERLLKAASRAAAQLDPVPAAPNLALAHLYLATRRPALALAEAERAKSLDPGPEAHMLAGAARMEQGDLRGADVELRAALAIDPDYVPARGELGRLQARAGQYALAVESFKAVLEREPGNLNARENLRAALAELGTPEADGG